jgi:hypothetical protein
MNFKRVVTIVSIFIYLCGSVQASPVRHLSFDQKLNSNFKATESLSEEDTINEENQNRLEDPYFIISSVTVTDLGEKNLYNKMDIPSFDLGEIIASLDSLIAFGTKVWEIVKKGKPVVNVDLGKPISILPLSNDPNMTFFQMENWSAPKARKYRIEYKNLMGMKVIAFDYTVQFQHNGSYQNTGNYITGLQVTASNVAVSWGYTFNASTELVSISNRGRLDDPIAGGTLTINYEASTALRTISSSETFHVTGVGEILKF